MSMEARQVVHSPERVALHLAVAGPTSRMLAYAVDYAVILCAELLLFLTLVLAYPFIFNRLTSAARLAIENRRSVSEAPVLAFIAVFIVVQLVIETGYFVVCELTSGGRSLGKALVGLRVVSDGGFPIGARESLVRNLLRAADVLPWSYVIGLIAMFVSEEGKRLGDLVAGTIVVRLDRPLPAPAIAAPPVTSGFSFERAQIERLDANELALLRGTLRRLGTLDAEQKAQILERATTVLCARIGYGPVTSGEREIFLRAQLDAARRR